MRRFILQHRWATVLVACLLLFATSGMSLTRMTCLIGGHTALSLGQSEDCCPAEEGSHGPELEASCCAQTQAVLDDVQLIPSSAGALDLDLLASGICHSLWAGVPTAPVLPWIDSRPPPIAVMERLAALHTLLI